MPISSLAVACKAILTALTLTITCPTASLSWPAHGAAIGSCPFGTSFADGCPTAPTNGDFQQSNFLTSYARQSSQTWSANHPMGWNVACVDYKCGYDTTLSLKDPTTAALPSGCAYQPTGNPNGGPWVNCTGSGAITFNGYDFSLHNGVMLEINTNATYTSITLTNDKFLRGTGIASGLTMFQSQAPSANVDIEDTHFDGNWSSGLDPGDDFLFQVVTSGTFKMRYDVMQRSAALPINCTCSGGHSISFNYYDNIGLDSASAAHIDIMVGYYPPANSTVPNEDATFNTVLLNSTSRQNGSTGANFWTAGAYPVVITEATEANNTIVDNLNSGSTTAGALLFQMRANAITTLNVQTNYGDPTGALSCQALGPIATNIAGSITGNTLTVTSLDTGAGKALIDPGAVIFGTGITGTPVIQPYGTSGTSGTGTTGTYIVSGSSQTTGAQTGWQTTTAVTTTNFTGNVNLTDGSAITSGNALFQGAQCNNVG